MSRKKGFKHSDETKEKMRLVRIGKYSGENSSFFGKHNSKETKQKLRLAKLGDKNYNFGKHLSKEIKRKMRLNRKDVSGTNHPNWKGGTD